MARPRLEVADVFRAHGAAWRKANAGHVSLGQLKVMSAIETCRTSALGGHVERCEELDPLRYSCEFPIGREQIFCQNGRNLFLGLIDDEPISLDRAHGKRLAPIPCRAPHAIAIQELLDRPSDVAEIRLRHARTTEQEAAME